MDGVRRLNFLHETIYVGVFTVHKHGQNVKMFPKTKTSNFFQGTEYG